MANYWCKPHQSSSSCSRSYRRQPRNESHKRGLNTKLHLAVDAHGMPVRLIITQGTTADCTQAKHLIAGIDAEYLLADRGYDSNAIIDQAIEQGMKAVIPPRKNRKLKREYDTYLYTLRHLVENAFLHLKRWRGIATRYAKNSESFLAAVQVRCISLWANISWRHYLAYFFISRLLLKAQKSGKYYLRTNIVAGLTGNKSIAPFVSHGACNTELFNDWVEQFLIKELKPGQTVILDNASFHKSLKTKELIESVGCRLLFLPPYSPDLNPIEKFWAKMKRWVKSKVMDVK